MLKLSSAIFVGLALLFHGLASAQSTATKQVTQPTPNTTNGGSIAVPTESDGHVNVPSPPGKSTSMYPPNSTVQTPSGSGNPMGASGSKVGNQ